MTIVTTTFDRMPVTASDDAIMYKHLSRNIAEIVSGVGEELEVTISGLNARVATGACVIYGRLVRVTELESVTIPANSTGWLVIEVDLGKINTSTGTPGTPGYVAVNNQVSIKYVTSQIKQNLTNGGLVFHFTLAKVTSTASSATAVPERVDSTLALGKTAYYDSVDMRHNTLYSGGIMAIPKKKGDMFKASTWVNTENFASGITYMILTSGDTSGWNNLPFNSCHYVVMSDGYSFYVVAYQIHGNGIKTMQGVNDGKTYAWTWLRNS